ncbi:hypothetical protein MSAN_02462300 [Mycena sanguinolenta]|uniref:Exonuclease V n=1 Tax=Mycena sanguinolenta TaxID=230812 RepID=A0A8H6WWX8_9AGAR|nr:hypothetical protein MSAN_02462300 [Mycena sanguinolenta]
MSDDESEYDVFDDFASLTEEDFARLDATVSSVLDPPVSDDSLKPCYAFHIHRARRILPQCENGQSDSPISPPQRHSLRYRLALIGLFGKSAFLEALFFGVQACEVQFDYGLRQKRFRPLESRPASFRAESGKEIIVQQDVAAQNDKITKRGQFIHKELERELKPEEIEILIASEEERWAFRLLNFLSSLVLLREEGYVREIPVFGIVDGVVVVGIVDELSIRDEADSLPCPSPPPIRARTPDRDETRLGFGPAIPKASVPKSVSTLCIRVIDTKTRRKDYLPSDEDAKPAHLQVMVYHRLLARLIDTSDLFDFSAIWTPLGVRPAVPFSVVFLKQATQILGSDSVPVCLNDVVLLFQTRIADLHLPRLDDTLQIIYRSQNKYPIRHEAKGKAREDTISIPAEDTELAKALAMSLEDAFEAQLAAALKESAELAYALPAFVLDAQAGTSNLDRAGVQGQGPVADLSLVSGPFTGTLNSANDQAATVLGRESTLLDIANEGSPPQDTVTVPARPEIIGTKDFTMDNVMLDTYLQSALDWWRGNRPARGVSETQTNRCFSCEYRDGCEWREKKGAEKLEEARQRRALGGTMTW